jgi:tetratricopeptide (TPR) repeat protein
MRSLYTLALVFISISTLPAQKNDSLEFTEPMFKPFIERYVLDELKNLRTEQQKLREDVAEKVAQAKLESSDRAITYTTDTVNNIFYIITATASILVLMGWTSLRDINKRVKLMVDEKVKKLTDDYEGRLSDLEETLKTRSEQLIKTQEEVVKSNNIRAIWMRAALEPSVKEKISLYDEILEINPDNVEAITYKADAVLELGEDEWALNLANKAIEHDDDYGYAFWQKACAEAELGMISDAVEDLKLALKKTPSLKAQIKEEESFKHLIEDEDYKKLLKESKATEV